MRAIKLEMCPEVLSVSMCACLQDAEMVWEDV